MSNIVDDGAEYHSESVGLGRELLSKVCDGVLDGVDTFSTKKTTNSFVLAKENLLLLFTSNQKIMRPLSKIFIFVASRDKNLNEDKICCSTLFLKAPKP